MRRIFIVALVTIATATAHASDSSCITSAKDNPNACKDVSATRIVAGSHKRVPQPKPVATQPDPNTSIPIGVVVDVHDRGKKHKEAADVKR